MTTIRSMKKLPQVTASKQDNGGDVELSTEVMVVDVDKQDSNMLMVTKLIYFAS